MSITQLIRCPNCGSFAEKNHLENHIMRTSCNSCDYLMVQCAKTGKVIESYAPGINYVMSTASRPRPATRPTAQRRQATRPATKSSTTERPLVAHKQH
ncbi:MAG: hypothetical protein AAGA80_03130 [Cyanobacteria bacterium P01_F01_bin.143]